MKYTDIEDLEFEDTYSEHEEVPVIGSQGYMDAGLPPQPTQIRIRNEGPGYLFVNLDYPNVVSHLAFTHSAGIPVGSEVTLYSFNEVGPTTVLFRPYNASELVPGPIGYIWSDRAIPWRIARNGQEILNI